MADSVPCTADSVLAAIDARRPGLKLAKRHLLLYFAQGHHLAHFGTPLFNDPIVAMSGGNVAVGAAGIRDEQPTGEGQLNTIGYVVERYGALSPEDLRTLVRASTPWKTRNAFYGHGQIDLDDLRDWFRRDDETNDPDDERPNRAERAAASELWNASNAGH